MHSKSVLDQQDITRLLDAARQRALAEQWAVTIAVVDDGGHPLALERMDGCAPASAYIALEKARSAALGRRETRDYEQMVNGGRTAFVTAPLLTSLEGGVPLRVDGQVIGAIGVSGVRPEQDAQVAKAGATGL
ncbi:heme-binding protein [Pseudomonas sp. microsymbiont 2]